MKNKDALAILNELHKINHRTNDWTKHFLETVDWDVRMQKRNLSPAQGAKLLEIYEKATEDLG